MVLVAVLVVVVGGLTLAFRSTTKHSTPRLVQDLDTPADVREPVAERLADSRVGIAPGWMDFGYSRHIIEPGRPIEVDFSSYGGLILGRLEPLARYGGLTFRYRAPDTFGDFLEVQLQGSDAIAIERVRVQRARANVLTDGYLDVWLSMRELNPRGKPFDRVMFFAHDIVERDLVQLDNIAFTAEAPVATRPVTFALNCQAPPQPISPLIYGVAAEDDGVWELSATARRWGGNPTSRYNWELGTDNRASDWYFANGGNETPERTYESFLEENLERGLQTALTVPTIGWVAKDPWSVSFPVSLYGPQQATAGNDRPDAGNGMSPGGRQLMPGPPTRTSVPSPPENIQRWVRAIREKDAERPGRSVHTYILDNEPMLWNTTHRDVHPQALSYDELLERTLDYASAIRAVDPDGLIAGPAEWGWVGFHYSAVDLIFGRPLRFDRRLHGDVPLLPWYLRKIREHEQKTGVRILDLVDVHYYPAGDGIGSGVTGDISSEGAAHRIRSTRSLWDPTYVDESWINEPLRLLPLLKEWVAENRPGLGISIGEWNFGGERHMSGGIATAEVLGRFGTEGVTSAYYWTSPAKYSPSFWAFRAFRNFDGAGGRFLDVSIPVTTTGALTSLFASRNAARNQIVAVLLNQAERSPLAATVTLHGCGEPAAARAFTYTGGEHGFEPFVDFSTSGGTWSATVKPYSITVLDLSLAPAVR